MSILGVIIPAILTWILIKLLMKWANKKREEGL